MWLLALTLLFPLLLFCLMSAVWYLLLNHHRKQVWSRVDRAAALSCRQQVRRPLVQVNRPSVPHARFDLLCIEDAFDPDRAVLWETQVPALELIAKAAGYGVSFDELKSEYDAAARLYPELYEGSSFHAWLEFLIAQDLIARKMGAVAITSDGRAFLEFRMKARELAPH